MFILLSLLTVSVEHFSGYWMFLNIIMLAWYFGVWVYQNLFIAPTLSDILIVSRCYFLSRSSWGDFLYEVEVAEPEVWAGLRLLVHTPCCFPGRRASLHTPSNCEVVASWNFAPQMCKGECPFRLEHFGCQWFSSVLISFSTIFIPSCSFPLPTFILRTWWGLQ